MKKIVLLVFLLLLLGSCGGKKEESKQDVLNIQQNKNIIEKGQEKIKEQEQNSDLKVDDTKKESPLKKEEKKWDTIVNSKSGMFFYKLDCKKLFKIKQIQKECEVAGLKEAGFGCIDESYFGTDDINKIFDRKKFDLIEDKTFQKYKTMCIQQFDEIKKLEEERANKLEQERKNVSQKIK